MKVVNCAKMESIDSTFNNRGAPYAIEVVRIVRSTFHSQLAASITPMDYTDIDDTNNSAPNVIRCKSVSAKACQ